MSRGLAKELQERSKGSIQTLFAACIVEELLRNQVRHFVVSPGARAIPIIAALEELKKEHEFLEVHLVNDERAAAFFAQGLGKVGELSCLVCTTGTAAANYLPGVVEAHYAKVPLIVLTCDRPWELHHAKANQTIEQEKIFGKFTKLDISLPAPEKYLHPHSLFSNIDQLVRVARSSAAPVHLNVSFRKPFHDAGFNVDDDLDKEELSLLQDWSLQTEPYVSYPEKVRQTVVCEPQNYLTAIPREPRVLVIAGPLNDQDFEDALVHATSEKNIPVLADINSQLRGSSNTNCFSFYNFFLRLPDFQEAVPDVIYYAGDRFISDELWQYVSRVSCPVVRVSRDALRGDLIENEYVKVSAIISPEDFIDCHLAQLGFSDDSYLQLFSVQEEVAKEFVEELSTDIWQEGLCVKTVLESFGRDTVVQLSASLIFRLADMLVAEVPDRCRIFTNRGATGIDGVIASSVGLAHANDKDMLCVIGDQAALHDLTSLSLLKKLKGAAVVLILNNQGGAIFNIMKIPDVIPSLRNDHEYHFEDFARGFSLEYEKTDSIEDVLSVIDFAKRSKSKVVIEMSTNGAHSAQLLRLPHYFAEEYTAQYKF